MNHPPTQAQLFHRRFFTPSARSVPRSTPPAPTASERLAFALRRESERRLASLEASVRQLEMWEAKPDQCVLDEIASLRAGLAFLADHLEPKNTDAR